HLAGAGRHVTVLDRGTGPGGLAVGTQVSGYRFDSGPTVLTMPEFIGEALGAVGEELGSALDLVRLDPAYQARFADGSTIAVRTDPDAMAEEIAAHCAPGEVDGYRRLVRVLRSMYQLEAPTFIQRNLDSVADLPIGRALRLVRMGGLRRWSSLVAAHLHDERLQRIFSFQALYAGLAPQRALGSYAVIAYMDCIAGVWYPRGGMATVPLALAEAGARHGVEYRYGVDVREVLVEHGRTTGVRTADGERIAADAVIWNADPATVPGRPAPRRTVGYAPSCVVWRTGTATTTTTEHHTISFGAAWQQTFDEIIRTGMPMTDPSVLISSPTRTDPALAPPGRHIHYTLFPTPNRSLAPGLDWSGYRDRMRAVLDSRGLGACVTDPDVQQLSTPDDWAALGLPAGTPFGPHHGIGQTGPLRTSTLDRRVENLVYCGSATQPGVGVPSVLVSGRLAAQRITGGA
ncbi:MAG: phytoene desaturase family protein, partial [Jatrophihabitans sp.]